MVNLSLALKATAVGILVAIIAMVFYNGFGRKVEENKLKWLALQSKSLIKRCDLVHFLQINKAEQ